MTKISLGGTHRTGRSWRLPSPLRSFGSGIASICALAVCLGLPGCSPLSEANRWIERSYSVFFQWKDGRESIHVIDDNTGRPESDPVLRRVVSDESRRVVDEILRRTELTTAEGRFNLTLSGSAEPYLMSSYAAEIPKLDELMNAATIWDLKDVRKILEGSVNVNALALDSGNTALILAASDPAKLFSRARIARFTNPPDGRTVHFLLSAGANPNVKGYLGAAALMRAGDPFIAQDLINCGADVNVKDLAGWTALIHAIRDHNAFFGLGLRGMQTFISFLC
jgi:hypothetical protein